MNFLDVMNPKITTHMDDLWKRGMPFPGERESIERALEAARRFGYGNVMAWLATEWALKLVHDDGLNEKTAINAVSNRGPYALS